MHGLKVFENEVLNKNIWAKEGGSNRGLEHIT
jgi:hypothetical protein